MSNFKVGDKIRLKKRPGIYWEVVQELPLTGELLVLRRYNVDKYMYRLVPDEPTMYTKD